MFTIFEYLRKRARESVLSGVQEAVEYLDGKSSTTARTGPAPPPATVTTQPAETPLFNAQNYLAGPAASHNGQPEAIPPPRRRGRPPKNGEQA